MTSQAQPGRKNASRPTLAGNRGSGIETSPPAQQCIRSESRRKHIHRKTVFSYVVATLIGQIAVCRAPAGNSGLYDRLEPAVEHALAVERHVFWIAHSADARVFHHLGVDAVAMRARLVNDVSEHHRLAGLGLDSLRERRPEFHGQVVADTFAVFDRAVLAPNLARLLRHATVGVQVPFRNRQNESIYVVSHNSLLRLFGLKFG